MKQTLIALFIIIASATFFSCKSDSTTQPIETFTGITQTNINFEILSADPNDWLPIACLDSTCSLFNIVFAPNPTWGSGLLMFYIKKPMNLEMSLYSAPDKMVKAYTNALYEHTGTYTITLQIDSLENGIYRLYINATIDGKKYTTFGDIQIDKRY